MTNDAFIDIFGMGSDSAAIVMVEFQSRPVGDMGDQLAIRSTWRSMALCESAADRHPVEWGYEHVHELKICW